MPEPRHRVLQYALLPPNTTSRNGSQWPRNPSNRRSETGGVGNIPNVNTKQTSKLCYFRFSSALWLCRILDCIFYISFGVCKNRHSFIPRSFFSLPELVGHLMNPRSIWFLPFRPRPSYALPHVHLSDSMDANYDTRGRYVLPNTRAV